MSLIIYSSSSKEMDGDKSYLDFHFEDDGYYWYMFSSFQEIAKKTNQMIDLYGSAKFFGENLEILEKYINLISKSLKNEPVEWNVKTDNQISPEKKEIFSSVNKKEFEQLIHKFLLAIEKAKSEKKWLIFEGD